MQELTIPHSGADEVEDNDLQRIAKEHTAMLDSAIAGMPDDADEIADYWSEELDKIATAAIIAVAALVFLGSGRGPEGLRAIAVAKQYATDMRGEINAKLAEFAARGEKLRGLMVAGEPKALDMVQGVAGRTKIRRMIADAMRTGNTAKIDAAVEALIAASIRSYTADQLHRARAFIRNTIAEAYDEAVMSEFRRAGVQWVRIVLSPRHPRYDMCDPITTEDRYGKGKGVHPIDQCPPLPLHPQCLCMKEAVK